MLLWLFQFIHWADFYDTTTSWMLSWRAVHTGRSLQILGCKQSNLVRPHIEYASYSCMDPYHVTDITRCKRLPYECVANSGIQATLSFWRWLCSTPWWLWIDIGWRLWRKSCWLHGHATTRTCYCWSGALLLRSLGEEKEDTPGLPLPLFEFMM